MDKLLQIHKFDNVAVALENIAIGEFSAVNDIPKGHKIALKNIAKGENIIKYGMPIGYALDDIVAGEQTVVSARPAYCAVAGGLIGYGGYLDMSDCVVDCQIGNGKRPMVAWGGMVGFLVRPFKLKDSRVHMNGYFQRVAAFKMNRAVIAVVPCKSGSNEADVAGSEITGNLSLSGYILSSGSTLSSDDKSNLSSTLTTKVCGDLDKAKAYLVAGESFTSNAGLDFESANITYSAQ